VSEKSAPDKGGQTAVKDRNETEKPRLYKVLLHNDDFTTMEFVVDVLVRFFHKDEAEATHLMLYVHHKGRAVAGVYTRDIAETKVVQVTDYAQSHGYPLLTTCEPE